jgi:hypothetical protein
LGGTPSMDGREGTMALFRDLWLLVRDLPALIADRCDRTVRDAHLPVRAPTDDVARWPHGWLPWCVRCRVAWPCEPFVRITDRLGQRQRIARGNGGPGARTITGRTTTT